MRPPWKVIFGALRLGLNLPLEKEVDLMLIEFTVLPTGKQCLVFLAEVPKLSFEMVVLNLVDPKV